MAQSKKPAKKSAKTSAKKSTKKSATKTARKPAARSGASSAGGPVRLYTLEVFLLQGQLTPEFVKRNKVISRSIQIRGDQTLEDLHQTIFDAYDRFDPHMYEFQLGGKGPMDPKARRYVLSLGSADDFNEDQTPAGHVEEATMDSLGLKVDDAFGYWFDFGDDWWHQVNVEAIDDHVGPGQYPKITKRVGESPPQYPDLDEEDEEDEADDDEE